MVLWTVKIKFLIFWLPWIAQACQHRGDVCGLNSFYCYDELSESWQCQCEAGYENRHSNRGNHFSCTDINECLIHQHNCDKNTWCSNIEGSFRCLCIEGFHQLQLHAGYHICIDLDECSQNARCPENSLCVNLAGSYNCTCVPGFTQGGGFCYDVDECILHGQELCGIYAVCINQIGSYRCRCADGNLNTSCTDTQIPVSGVPTLGSIPVSNFNEGGAVDRDQISGGNNGVESELREMEPQNTSVFVGVGVGLGIFLISTVIVVGCIVFVKKRRRARQSDSVQMDLSPLRLSVASITEMIGGSSQTAASTDPKEPQYYTISPEPNTHQAASTDVESLYSNHKIDKIGKVPFVLISPGQIVTPAGGGKEPVNPVNPEEVTVEADSENPIVYQIFNGTGDPSSNKSCGVMICNANPKTLKSPIPSTCSSEQLNYATIFDNSEQNTNYLSSVDKSQPENIPAPSSDDGGGLVSTDKHSTATYDRLEKRSIRSKVKAKSTGQYENLYGETSENHEEPRQSSAYELVQIINNK